MKSYPYTAFVLTPSMRVKEVTIVRAGYIYDWVKAEDGTGYYTDQLHPTLSAAIAAGHAKLDRQADRLEKQAFTLTKRRATLNAQVAK